MNSPPTRPPSTDAGRRPHCLHGDGWTVVIADRYSACFPEETFADYASFVEIEGDVLKRERRTRVVAFSRPGGSEAQEENGRRQGRDVKLVLKVYTNPHLSGILTCFKKSIAETEYENLRRCRELGVPAVEPVAFGALRVPPAMVRSCFLVSRFCEDSIDLREWLRSRSDRLPLEPDGETRSVLAHLGVLMRRLHARSFFLGNPTLRNILLERLPDETQGLRFLDMPFARTVSGGFRARRAQARDLGAVSGPFLRRAGPGVLAPFLETYLPDPVAPELGSLETRLQRAARVHNNQTAVSRMRRHAHRGWMRFARLFSARSRRPPDEA